LKILVTDGLASVIEIVRRIGGLKKCQGQSEKKEKQKKKKKKKKKKGKNSSKTTPPTHKPNRGGSK
jgi:hypothetical protein